VHARKLKILETNVCECVRVCICIDVKPTVSTARCDTIMICYMWRTKWITIGQKHNEFDSIYMWTII